MLLCCLHVYSRALIPCPFNEINMLLEVFPLLRECLQPASANQLCGVASLPQLAEVRSIVAVVPVNHGGFPGLFKEF